MLFQPVHRLKVCNVLFAIVSCAPHESGSELRDNYDKLRLAMDAAATAFEPKAQTGLGYTGNYEFLAPWPFAKERRFFLSGEPYKVPFYLANDHRREPASNEPSGEWLRHHFIAPKSEKLRIDASLKLRIEYASDGCVDHLSLYPMENLYLRISEYYGDEFHRNDAHRLTFPLRTGDRTYEFPVALASGGDADSKAAPPNIDSDAFPVAMTPPSGGSRPAWIAYNFNLFIVTEHRPAYLSTSDYRPFDVKSASRCRLTLRSAELIPDQESIERSLAIAEERAVANGRLLARTYIDHVQFVGGACASLKALDRTFNNLKNLVGTSSLAEAIDHGGEPARAMVSDIVLAAADTGALTSLGNDEPVAYAVAHETAIANAATTCMSTPVAELPEAEECGGSRRCLDNYLALADALGMVLSANRFADSVRALFEQTKQPFTEPRWYVKAFPFAAR